jgi:NTE family protein
VKTLLLVVVLFIASISAVCAQEEKIEIGGLTGIRPADTSNSRQVVLALSGGGARGLAAIGVIKAFEEKKIEIAAIAGTSMGGIIGGLYACGYSPDELSFIIYDLDFNEFFVDAPERETMFLTRRQESERHLISVRFDNFRPVIPQGWTGGQKITAVLNRLTSKANYRCGGDFTKLPIPFKTVATDVITGKEVVIEKGSISEAMRATMAFPLAITAVESNGYMLMDGGMVTPVPVAIVSNMNKQGNLVVAINTASKLSPKDELKTPVDIAGQVTTIMTADRLAAQLKQADFVIEPPLGNLESSDFDIKDSLISIGYKAGLKVADSIARLVDSKEQSFQMKIVDIDIKGLNELLKEKINDLLMNKIATKSGLIKILNALTLEFSLFQLTAQISYESSDSKNQNIRLRIEIFESLPVKDYSFVVSGATLYPMDSLAALFADGKDYLNSSDVAKGKSSIENRYEKDGFDAAYVRNVGVDYDKKIITIEMDEAIVQSVDVEENKRTLDWLVRSYFPIKVGEPYSTAKAAAGLDNLYGTDLFEQIIVELVPSEKGARVKIKVKERYYTQLRIGWHWDDDYKSEQFFEILDDNIRGMGLEYMLHAQYAEDRQRYFAQLKMDRIWFTYLTARINGYHNRVNKSIYDAEGKEIDVRKERRTGFEMSLGQQVKRFGTVRGAFTMERVRNRYQENPGELDFNQRIFSLESIIETFDSPPFPNTGKKLFTEFRYAEEFLGGDIQYTRFFASVEGYFPFGKYFNFHPRVSLGLSGSELPVSEQFFIGGAGSFSGYRSFEYAGDKVILLNNELRLKLPFNLYALGRYDVGEVYVHTEQIKLRNLRHGWGAFMAYDSPIGPFELGYGVADSDNDRFYVNIGLKF